MKMSDAKSQDLSKAMTVISARIEGLTASKSSMVWEMWKREHCHCVCLQEIHRAPHLARPKITGITFVAERPHIKYGSTIIIISDLKVKGVSVWEQDNVELISIEMPGVVVHSVYKPPNEKFVILALGYLDIVIGDFNSHIINGDIPPQTTMEKRLNKGQIYAISHWSTMRNYQSRSTVQDGREAATTTSPLYLKALLTCVENQSWNLSLTSNTVQSVDVQTR